MTLTHFQGHNGTVRGLSNKHCLLTLLSLIQSLYGDDLENYVKAIKILSNLLTIPKLQYIKIGQNPSFGSRGRCFWSKFCIQIAGVTLKMSLEN